MAKKSQLQRFKEAARELEADNDTARLEARLGKLAKAKPSPKPKSKKPSN